MQYLLQIGSVVLKMLVLLILCHSELGLIAISTVNLYEKIYIMAQIKL